MKEVPYSTTDDESQWCGHIWRQRREIGGPWGFAWKVTPPHSEDDIAHGWCSFQDHAESRMTEVLKAHAGEAE